MICADFLAGAHLEGGNPRIPAVFHAPPLSLSAGCAETGILAAGNRRPRETSPAKRRRIRLDADAYRRLHQEILERGGWRCQTYGSLRGQVIHIQRRSQSGDDSEGNLITLCSDCHRAIHAYWQEPIFRGTTPG